MSYINPKTLKHQKRRPSVRHVTPEEAIEQANKVVDEANDKIARQMANARAWENVAAGLYEENEGLRKQIATLESRVAELEAENARLLRRATKRQGKHKGQEWEVDE